MAARRRRGNGPRTLNPQEAREVRQRLDRLGLDSLAAYWQTDHWQRTRRREMGARPTCWVCEARRAVQLHHTNYVSLMREGDGDLIPVCVPCHKAVHRMHVEKGKPLDEAHVAERARRRAHRGEA